MAESGLSLAYTELRQEVGYFLGYGRTIANWSTVEVEEIDLVVQAGVRRVYYPIAVNQETIGYEWSWLRPTTTLTLVDGTSDYDLPDDLGRLVGDLHFAADEQRPAIKIIAVGQILELRSTYDEEGAPRYAAIRFVASDGTVGSRQEILFWPEPDDAYVLSYQYEAYNGPLSAAAPYPLGGMQCAELFVESCLAVAESRMNDEAGLHNQQFQALLVDAIARDRKRGPKYFGNMGHREEAVERIRHGDTGSTYPITYDGVDV